MLQTLLLLIGALAVLVVGSGALPAAAAEAAPCHAEMAMTHHGEAPGPATPDKAMKSMGCCVACVAAPLPRPPEKTAETLSPQRLAAPRLSLPPGLSPAPEPFPPRV